MFDVRSSPLDAAALEAAVRAPGRGGVVTFAGIVREIADDGRAVTGLSYEAYAPMVLATFQAIAEEARARYGDVRLAIAHRVGDLDVGDVAVAVVAAAPHRAAAFDACEYAIDELKRRAPIWKKERYLDGTSTWKENACDGAG